MTIPKLDNYELLLPLDDERESRSWLGRDVGTMEDHAGVDLVVVEQFSGDFLDRDDQRREVVDEVERVRNLEHPNLYRTRAAGRLGGHFAIVHDFPVGERLDAVAGAMQMEVPVAMRIIADVTETLAYTHQSLHHHHGALHPAVIYVCWDGKARVGRYGSEKIVRRARHNWGRLNPRQLSYLSPEHCTNDRLDLYTDIFNIGTIFWELLTGRILFQEEDEFERMRAICEEQAPPPTRFNDAIPPLLNSLVLKALAIDPSERFPDANRMREVFQGVLSRTREPASHEAVLGQVESIASQRLRRWRGLEQARREGNLDDAIDHVAALFGVDPEGARRSGGATGGDRTGDTNAEPVEPTHPSAEPPERPEGRSSDDDERTRKRRLEKLRAQKPDRPEEDVHREKTRKHDQDQHPVAQDFEVDETDDSVGSSLENAVESVSRQDWLNETPAEGEESVSGGDDPVPDPEEARPVDHDGFEEESYASESGATEFPAEELESVDPSEPPADEKSAQDLVLEDASDEQEAPTVQVEISAESELEDPTAEQLPPQEENREGEREGEGESTRELSREGGFFDESDRVTVDEDVDADLVENATSGTGGAEPNDPTEPEVPAQREPEIGGLEESAEQPEAEADAGADAPSPDDGGESPDAIDAQLRTMSIDEWLGEEEDQEPFEEPFPLSRVIEDRGQSDQKRVKQPALEIISIGDEQPLEVSVLRGRQSWSHEGVPVVVHSRGNRAHVDLRPPSSGWIARASNPGQRESLPEPPAQLELQPGDVAEVSDGEVTYRFRYFHPPKSPNHIEREHAGRTVGTYAVATAIAVIFHVVAALGIITLHQTFGVTLSVRDKPRKEVFAKGKLKKFEEKKKKKQKEKKPEPPEPPEPTDPAEQEANVPEEVQKEINEKLEEKKEAAEDKTKAEALAAALKGSSDPNKNSLSESVSNIDAVDSPSGSSSNVEIGGKLKGTEGNEVKMATGSGESELGNIGSQLGEGTGDLQAREDKKEKVRGTVDSVSSQADVSGRLARSKVSRVVNQHKGQIQGCYEQQLLKNPGIGGKVSFEWTITRSGSVSGARQKSSTLNNAAVSNCILGIIRRMKFPKPKGGSVTVTYPFMFRSGG